MVRFGALTRRNSANQNLSFGIGLHPQFPPDIYLEGAIIRHHTLSREHQGPR